MIGPDVRERAGVTDVETDIHITTGKVKNVVHVVKEVATINILREALSKHLLFLQFSNLAGEEKKSTIDN